MPTTQTKEVSRMCDHKHFKADGQCAYGCDYYFQDLRLEHLRKERKLTKVEEKIAKDRPWSKEVSKK